MTGRSKKTGFAGETLHLACLCASLALFISLASPADDALQQESAPCRRHQSVTLLKATHPVDAPARIRACPSVSATGPRLQATPARLLTTALDLLFSDSIQGRQRADLPHPQFFL